MADPPDDDSSPTIEVVQKQKLYPEGSMPEIKIGYSPAGRATLDAIADELAPNPVVARPVQISAPEISVRETFASFDTLAAILSEAQPAAEPAGVELFEMVTFVVRGVEAAKLSSAELRRDFVERALLRRLPVSGMADVDRVDVTPWTVPGTLVLRVWCKLPA